MPIKITPLIHRRPEEEETLQTQPEEEEEPVRGKLLQRQEEEEKEEPVRGKLLHRQEEEEEEPVQGKYFQRQAEEEEEELPIQGNPDLEEKTPEVTSSVEGRINSFRGGGSPMPESLRAYFEPRFGYDFGSVRLHRDSNAVETARAVNAQAFTFGNNIVFGSSRYAPETGTGKKLLAHELTHVVQQGACSPLTTSGPTAKSSPEATSSAKASGPVRIFSKGNNDGRIYRQSECDDIRISTDGPMPPSKRTFDTDFEIDPTGPGSGVGFGYMSVNTDENRRSASIFMSGFMSGHYGWISNDRFRDSDSGRLSYECRNDGTIRKTDDFGGTHSSPPEVEVSVEHPTPSYRRTGDAFGAGDNAVEGRVKAVTEVKIYPSTSVSWSAGFSHYAAVGIGGSAGVSYGSRKFTMEFPYAYKCVCRR